MSKLRLRISMSFDGYTSGPDQSVKERLGVGGEGLHEWVVALRSWREAHGKTGGVDDESTRVFDEEIANIGATAGGARVCRQYLNAGIVDEMLLHQVPIFLGGGERLFEGVANLHGLEPAETIATPNVTHFSFRKR